MESNKNKKYFMLGIAVVVLISVFIVGINFLKSKPKEVEKKTISKEETQSMLSYTLDGEKTDIKPTKEDGYIANKIVCENGSNFIWDNTNWEVEIISLESNDVCSVDFTKDINTNGYRVTATTNVEGSIDSLSKATIENGTIIFYPNKGQEITTVSGCLNGKLENNKVIVSNVTSNQTCNIEVKIPLPTLYATLSDGIKYTIGTRTDFSTVFGGETIQDGYNSTGKIYLSENNYYFAGNPSDNWVKFANKWWRIIRTNSIEGTRLLYAGTSHDGKDGFINNANYKWSNSYNNVSDIQWNTAISIIGNILINWYDDNIIGDNIIMINDSIKYCNDISEAILNGSDIYFGSFERLVNNKKPSYLCANNGNTTHTKIGMMTADEVVYAGGVSGSNAPNTYYYRNSITCPSITNSNCSATGNHPWWTMSPYAFFGPAHLFIVIGSGSDAGKLSNVRADYSRSIRPVITLLPTVKVSGSGTTDDPFIPSL